MIIVTGGCGFIGSWICEYLAQSRKEVLAIDNFCTGRRKNIDHMTMKNFKVLCHDVTKKIDLEEVEEVYHLASPASPVAYGKLSLETALTNSLGTRNILEIARKNNAKFLLASTSEVYGNPKEHPQNEKYWGNVNPIGPRACYDEGKRFSETLTMEYHKKYGIDTKIVRIFNTYGPRMRKDDGRVIPTFIIQALNNQLITVNGDGSQTRSFCYVSDMVSGIIKIMKKANEQPINLGNPYEITINHLAEKIIAYTKSQSQIKIQEMPQDDPVKRKPDISKAKALGWEPRISLEEGLQKTIDYFMEDSEVE